jgi:hypothetical protein
MRSAVRHLATSFQTSVPPAQGRRGQVGLTMLPLVLKPDDHRHGTGGEITKWLYPIRRFQEIHCRNHELLNDSSSRQFTTRRVVQQSDALLIVVLHRLTLRFVRSRLR